MIEALTPTQEIQKPTPMDELMAEYKSACHEADFRSDSEDECALCYDCARSELVNHGLGAVKSSADCDRIISELDDRYPGLQKVMYSKRDAFRFTEILDEFHDKHGKILTQSTSSDEDDEALEKDRCARLRLSCIRESLGVVATQAQCQQLLGIILPQDTYLYQLIEEKMALLPIETRLV